MRARWNPLLWAVADRSLLAIVIVLGAVATFAVTANLWGGWPYLRHGVDPEALALLGRVSLLLLVPWAALLGVALLLRRGDPAARVLVLGTVLSYALTTAVFTCLTGPFSSPGWMAFLGGATVAFLLFDARAVALGVIVFFALVVGGAALIESGALPLAAELAALSGLGRGTGIARGALTSIVLSSFTLVVVGHIIGRWRDHEALLEKLSRTDALTGVANRRQLHALLEQELERVRRHCTPLACVMVDLDHFKHINDRHGHLVGDLVLSSVARTLAATLRDVDTIGRYGGEEFLIVLPATSSDGAARVAARSLAVIRDTPIVAGQTRITVTASMGIASVPPGRPGRAEDLIREADRALYRAKEGGRDRIEIAAA